MLAWGANTTRFFGGEDASGGCGPPEKSGRDAPGLEVIQHKKGSNAKSEGQDSAMRRARRARGSILAVGNFRPKRHR